MYTYETPVSKRTLKDRLSIPSIRRKKQARKQPAPVVENPFRLPLQRFLILPHEEQIITGRLGTNIVFPANAFVYSSGAPVFEEVEIELKEVMTKRDAVRENLTTTSDNAFLESGGMLYINASSGGENVYLNPETPAQIEMPRSQNVFLAGTDLFTGQRRMDDVMNWRITDTHLQGKAKQKNAFMRRLTKRRPKGSDTFTSFLFETTMLGWMNCDRYFNVPKEEVTKLSIKTQMEEPVEMKVVLKEFNSILPVMRIGENYVARVPRNKTATITGFCQKGDQCFFGTKKIVLGEGTSVQLDMQEKTVAEVKKQLKKL